MDEWLKSFGPGKFTFGAKSICFLPDGIDPAAPGAYRSIAQAPDGKYDSPDWLCAAERITDYLNELREIGAGR